MADESEIQGELNEGFDVDAAFDMSGMPSPPPAPPPPTIDDIQIPPPPPTIDDIQIPPPPDESPPPEDPTPPPTEDTTQPDEVDPIPAPTDREDPPVVEEVPSTSYDKEFPETNDEPATVDERPPDSVNEIENDDGDDDTFRSSSVSLSIENDDDGDDNGEVSSSIHQASTLPSTQPMMISKSPVSKKSKGKSNTSMTPEEAKAAMKAVSRYRRESVMWVFIFIMAVGVIAVIFYFSYSIAIAQSDSTPLPDGAFNFRVVVYLDNQWVPGLEISSDQTHIDNADVFLRGVERTLTQQNSSFVDVFETASEVSFSDYNSKIRTSFQCFLSGSPSTDITTDSALAELFEEELADGFSENNFMTLGLDTTAAQPIDVINFEETT